MMWIVYAAYKVLIDIVDFQSRTTSAAAAALLSPLAQQRAEEKARLSELNKRLVCAKQWRTINSLMMLHHLDLATDTLLSR